MKQSTEDKRKERYVYHVFQEIAGGYDRANQRISLGAHMRWKKEAAAFLIRHMPGRPHILDLGCGTGDMLRIFYEMNSHADLTGLDFSPHMLKIAGRNCRDINKLTLIRGNALKIPLPDSSFDGVSISFALRNTADYNKILKADRKKKLRYKIKTYRAARFESTNKMVATVNNKGVVKAKKKGSCYIYAYSQNGLFNRTKITVK